MPDLVRNFTARLRKFLRSRRCARRYDVRIPCRVEFANARRANNGSAASNSIEGYASDVSADGMALVLPAIRIGDRYLAGESHPLLVTLELPDSRLALHTVAVRYDTFADGDQTGYQVGVRITKLGQEERAHYVDFLAQLSRK
jgi:hypothetical protein